MPRSELSMAIGVDFSILDECVKEAARIVNAEPDDLLTPHGPRIISHARQGAMWMGCRRGYSAKQMAQYFSMDWTSVRHGIDAAQARYDTHTAARIGATT
jgi:hypothetical protein